MDLDGDGRPDAVVGLAPPAEGLYWYRQPHSGTLTDTWNRFTIAATGGFYEDVIGFDVNGDGAMDLIASVNGGINWYENPAGHGGDPTTDVWNVHVISTNAPGENNMALADLDGDGKIDVVTPDIIFFQNGPDSWTALPFSTAFRGVALLDIGSGKGSINIVTAGPNPYPTVWFEIPARLAATPARVVDHAYHRSGISVSAKRLLRRFSGQHGKW